MIFCEAEYLHLARWFDCVGQCDACKSGRVPYNYPVPALYDVYPDPEYIMMLYERAALTSALAQIRDPWSEWDHVEWHM